MSDTPTPEPSKEERNLQNLLSKHNGDAIALAATLLGENAGLRETNRSLKEKLPAEGSVTLSKTDAARWEAYQALGKPDEITERLTKGEQAAGELSKRDRQDSITRAAQAAGMKPNVLERLTPEGATYELREEQKDGKAVQVPYLKLPDGEHTLTAYADANWADFKESLLAAPPAPDKKPPTVPFSGSGKGAPTVPADLTSQKRADPSYKPL